MGLATILLIAVTAVWGGTFVVVSDIVTHMDVSDFLFWRFLMATTLLFVLRPRAVFKLSSQERLRGVLIGVVLGFGYVFQTVGLQHTSPTVSGFVTGMFIVFTPLLAGPLMKEPVGRAAWFGVALATAGLALISLHGASFGYGELLTLVCAALFALQIIGLSAWSTPENSYGLATLQLGTTTLIALVGTAFSGGIQAPHSSQVWLEVAFMGVFATAVAFVIQSWAQSHMSPTRAAVVLTMEPVFAGVFGVWAGDELTTRILAGGGLILLAMLVVELGPRRSREGELVHSGY